MKLFQAFAVFALLSACAPLDPLPAPDAEPVKSAFGADVKSAFGAQVTGRDWSANPSESRGTSPEADASARQ